MAQVPAAVANGAARIAGRYNANQMLRVVIGLRPPHLEAEEQFLRDLQTPGSPEFHRFLTPQEWNARFAPSAEDEQAVVDWGQSQGLTVTQRYPNRLVIDMEAPAGVIEKAFQIQMNQYQLGAATFFSNDRNPAIPAGLAGVIQSVQGLNSLNVLHRVGSTAQPSFPDYAPGPVAAPGAGRQAGGDPSRLSAITPSMTQGWYDPADLYSSEAYDYSALNHLGHCCNPLGNPGHSPRESSIAIASVGYVDPADIAGFQRQYAYLAYNFQTINVDGVSMAPDAEGTMDTEWATAMANSLNGNSASTAKIYLYSGANAYIYTFTDIFNRMLTDNQARVLSTSWGCAELYCYDAGSMNTTHAIFNQMVGQGWTLVAASGDGGATADCAHASVSYPASDPDVVAAGGTLLSLRAGPAYLNEGGWTGGTTAGSCSTNNGGSGGGISAYFSTPPYQAGLPGDTGLRSVPDMSLNAAYGQNVYYQRALVGYGGTSIAAPELAGFFAQANAYLLALGNICGSGGSSACAPMGNANYYLYHEALNAPYASHYPFYDIVTGCNSNDVTQGGIPYFCSTTGYDRVTGWGSANMLQLSWAINTYLAGESGPPTIVFSGPATGQWYNTDRTVSWTVADTSGNTDPANGVAGFSQAWDAAIADVSSAATPGSGNSFYTGPQTAGTNGSATLAGAGGQGCHTIHVQAWDNAGVPSGDKTYGPVCYDTGAPLTTATLSGPRSGSGYTGPVQATLSASDALSGTLSTVYQIDGGSTQTYSGPFTVSAAGSHTISFHSTDRAGNTEGTETTSFTITSGYTISGRVTLGGNGLGNATVALSGTQAGATLTNASGSYSLTVSPGGSYTVTPALTGYTFNPTSQNFNNVTASQTANFAATATATSYAISGQVSVPGAGLPGVAMTLSGSQSGSATTNASGNYSFVALAGGNYTITPSLDPYHFQPDSQSVNSLSANQTANFAVGSGPPPPVLLFPEKGTAGASLTAQLSWSAATGATSYDVHFGTYSPPPLVASASGTAYNPGTLAANTTYYWYIAAKNAFGSAASGTWAFSTGACAFALTPGSMYLDRPAQMGQLNVNATPASCGWAASAGGSFITIVSGGTGTGSGGVNFSVPANNSGAALTGRLDVAGQAAAVTQRATDAIFTDVNPPDYYFDFADTMYTAGVTAGCAPQPLRYCPGETITRGQMAVFLVTATLGTNTFNYTTTPYFTDVPATHPFFKFVQKLRDLGITTGCSATQFCPNDPVTRSQMAAFIIRARYETTPYTYPGTPYFTDVPANSLFFPFIQKMAQTGITAGCAPNLYCPEATLTRGQMAVFIATGLMNRLLPAGAPQVTAGAPATVSRGQTITATLTGANTHFTQGVTQVAVGAGVTPGSISVLSPTSLTVQLTANSGATPGPYSVLVTTGGEEAAVPNGVTVQ